MSRFYYKGLQHALTKYAVNPQWFTNLLSPTLGDLAIRSGVGALVGGGLGYLTGGEQRNWLGRPTGSTHLRNALIGALLGGTTLGAAPAAAEWLGLQAAKRGKINPFTSWALRRKGIKLPKTVAKATAAPEAAAVAVPTAAPEAAAVAVPTAAPEAAAVAAPAAAPAAAVVSPTNRITATQLELFPEAVAAPTAAPAAVPAAAVVSPTNRITATQLELFPESVPPQELRQYIQSLLKNSARREEFLKLFPENIRRKLEIAELRSVPIGSKPQPRVIITPPPRQPKGLLPAPAAPAAAAAAPAASAAASTPQKKSLIRSMLSRTKARLTNLFSTRKKAAPAALEKQSAVPQAALWQRFFAPTTGALAARIGTGAAVGGGLGYLSGSEQYDWFGRPVSSNRWSRALMGAALGGAALGGAPRAAEWFGRRGWQQGKTTPFTQWAQTRHTARSAISDAQKQMNEYLRGLSQKGVQGQQLDEAAAAKQQWYKQQVEEALRAHYNYRGVGMAPVPAPAPVAAAVPVTAPVPAPAPVAAAVPVTAPVPAPAPVAAAVPVTAPAATAVPVNRITGEPQVAARHFVYSPYAGRMVTPEEADQLAEAAERARRMR